MVLEEIGRVSFLEAFTTNVALPNFFVVSRQATGDMLFEFRSSFETAAGALADDITSVFRFCHL